jgi:hypothetical protein
MNLKLRIAIAAALAAIAHDARADAVTDWNHRACEILAEAKLGTPPAVRVMALVQTAVHEATVAARDASAEAAIAAANRAVLSKLVPAQQSARRRQGRAFGAAHPRDVSSAPPRNGPGVQELLHRIVVEKDLAHAPLLAAIEG